MYQKALVGAASRYIVGRNAVQTVYWRTISDSPNGKMLKVAKTFNFGNAKGRTPPPTGMQTERNIRFN